MKIKEITIRVLSLFCVIATLFPMLSITANAEYVSGYYRKNGTYVHGYYRRDRKSHGKSSNIDYSSFIEDYYSRENNKDSNQLDYYYGKNNQILDSTGHKDNRKIVNLYRDDKIVDQKSADTLVYVRGYYRKDGTYVRPHYRTHADSYTSNNFSDVGLSTLKPVERYSNYSYSNNTKSEENYLLYNTSLYDKTVNDTNATLLKKYAKAMESNSKRVSAIGKKYYQSIGLDSWISKIQTQFDINHKLDSETYITFILYDYVQSCNKTFDDIPETYMDIIPYYCAVLDYYQNGEISKETTKSFAIWFYSHWISKTDAQEQIEMDMSQSFSDVSKTDAYKNVKSNWIPTNVTYSSEMNSILDFYHKETSNNASEGLESSAYKDALMKEYYEEKIKEWQDNIQQFSAEYEQGNLTDSTLKTLIEGAQSIINRYQKILDEYYS